MGLVVSLGPRVEADELVPAPVVGRAAFVSNNSSSCVAVPGGSASHVAVVNITKAARRITRRADGVTSTW